MFGLGMPEIVALMVVGVLLFGRKLPEVGRFLGQGIVEFKRGMSGIEEPTAGSISRQEVNPEPVKPPQRITATAPKFDDGQTPKV
jgi:sec-independent protein translocase protein TatA